MASREEGRAGEGGRENKEGVQPKVSAAKSRLDRWKDFEGWEELDEKNLWLGRMDRLLVLVGWKQKGFCEDLVGRGGIVRGRGQRRARLSSLFSLFSVAEVFHRRAILRK